MRRVLLVGFVLVAAGGLATIECATEGRADPPAGGMPASSSWTSPEACEQALRAGRRRARRRGHAAIATWNVRWFPDGVPFGSRETRRPTNVDWLACAIAWLAVDVVALQEIQTHPAAVDAMARVISGLNARTRGRWRVALDDCAGSSFQHVGLLWDSSRVNAETLRVIGSINPQGSACGGRLRPGFGGRMRFAGGLDVHVVSVHFKSGAEPRSRELRRRAHGALPEAFAALQSVVRDDDVLFAGDFNTHGCPTCSPAETPEMEIEALGDVTPAFAPGLRHVAPNLGCSYYGRGRASSLDHFVATRAMRELPAQTRATVEGVCADLRCGRIPRRAQTRALVELSDHCPIVLEIPDRDRD